MRFFFLSLGLLACGGTTITIPEAGTDGGGSDATTGMDANADTTMTTDAADAAPCPTHCSPSTHEVLDCNEQVVKTCTATEACDIQTNTCVNACVAQKNNRQSIGCDFYPAYLEVIDQITYKCFAVVVANTWSAPAKVQFTYNGQNLNAATFARVPKGSGPSITYSAYDPMVGIPVGEVAIAFLSGNNNNACPLPPAVGNNGEIKGTTIGKSFHVTADVPVAVYQINPYGVGAVATGSSLLLPTTAWGSNYIVNTASPKLTSPPSFDIVAQENGTQVKLLPIAALSGGGGIPGGQAKQTVTFNLQQGDVAQIGQDLDLAGSIIETNKAVGVWSASPCMNYPQGVTFCDHGEQMLLPIQSLSSEYPAVPPRPRIMEPALWRIVGVVDGTSLTYSPAVNGAPAMLSKGQVADFESTGPFVVKSQDAQHPFEVFAYMSGGAWSKLAMGGYGDPDHVVITPPEQFLRDYVFFSDPTFPETNVVVVRAKNGNQFEDVKLDCLGNLTGWQALGNYEWARADLSTGNFQAVGGCDNGRHEIASKGPFGISVWGWGTPKTQMFTSYVSYGYPGGTNVRPINNVTVPAQ